MTGVQTCALPIWNALSNNSMKFSKQVTTSVTTETIHNEKVYARSIRSEERRVGKSVDLGGRRIIKKKKSGRDCRDSD